jgi:ribosome-binding factor A
MKYRSERLGKLIAEQLNLILLREIEFDGALPTITGVEVSSKLETAAVKVSVFPSEKAPAVLKMLRKEQGRLQGLLIRKLEMRIVPKIDFEIDRGPENAARVEKDLLDL